MERELATTSQEFEYPHRKFRCKTLFRGISDNPNPALKRLTISFLALEGKGLPGS